ncbi:MAG TPA: hypothetical protein VIH92_07690 [Solirubrobacteraceae bacterium]
MDNLYKRLKDFDESLKEFKAETYPSWQTAQIFNVLLAGAKEKQPNDPVVMAMSPAEEGKRGQGVLSKPISNTDVGTMRAVVKQLTGVVQAAAR